MGANINMNISRQRKYGSHLPVMELLFKYSDIKNVFEYGCGLYSTKFFIGHALSITSIEMQNKKWYDKIKKELISDKLNLQCMVGNEDAISYFNSTTAKYDFVFVDGIERQKCVMAAIGRSDIIAVHDIGLRAMKKEWHLVKVPENYGIIIMGIDYPSTTVFTSNKNLFNNLGKHPSVIIKTINL